MNTDIADIVKWARSQGWTVFDDTKGYSRFYDPEGVYITYYPATPSRPNRRMAGLKVALKKAGLPIPPPSKRRTRATQEGRREVTNTEDWVITFTFDVDPSVETMDEWGSRLDSFDASVARIPGRGVDVSVYAPGDLTMFEAINKTINEVAHVVQSGPPIGLEVLTEFEHARRAEAPTMPELMSAAEIAETLGIARQRVHQLRQSAATFPAPLAELRGGAVWDAAAVRKFADEWERKPGRPRSELQVLSRQEREAVLIAEQSLGAAAKVSDGQHRQGGVDAILTLPDGRKAAFEVTNLAAKGALHTASLLARDNHKWPLPGKWFWDIHVDSPTDLQRLKKIYQKVILICEAAGVADPGRLGWDPSADTDLQWLVQKSKSSMFGYPEHLATDMQKPGAMVVPAARGGVVDDSLSGFAADLGEAFKSPHIQRHFRKLEQTEADERHLFIALHDSALSFSTSSALMFGKALPLSHHRFRTTSRTFG